MTYEGLRLKLLEIRRKAFANMRNKKIKNKEFTIISNNCWGGMIYESYNLQKQSPTVGLFFFASDYVKFLKNIKEYTSNYELRFIKPEDSKWKEQASKDKRFGSYPIGIIDDIEIFFLHYKTEQEAKEKWEKRCKRINSDKILVKFNDQNECTEKDFEEFCKLDFKNKLFFTCKEWNNKNYIKIKQHFEKNHIMASYEPFGKNKYININNVINSL